MTQRPGQLVRGACVDLICLTSLRSSLAWCHAAVLPLLSTAFKRHGTRSDSQADEHYAGTMPSHGTETCTVVELMFSHNVIFETLGDAKFADRAEVVAYNALPGSMTKVRHGWRFFRACRWRLTHSITLLIALRRPSSRRLPAGPVGARIPAAEQRARLRHSGPPRVDLRRPRLDHLLADGQLRVLHVQLQREETTTAG